MVTAMPRKKKPPLTFAARMAKLTAARLKSPQEGATDTGGSINEGLESLEARASRILEITDQIKDRPGHMLFFVMYDIENDKVRKMVSRYLIRRGCTRIQRSVFLAEAPTDIFSSIKDDLTVVQAAYDNNDSIVVLPISTDYLRMMKIIGQKIDVDIITQSRNTLFF